jgi:hypothetical protein
MWLLGSRMYHKEKYVGAKYWLLRFLKESLQAKERSSYHQHVLEFVYKKQRLFLKIEQCHDSMMTFLAIRRFRQQSVLSVLPKDVAVLIAKIIWQTRNDDTWQCKKKLIKNGKKILKLKLT